MKNCPKCSREISETDLIYLIGNVYMRCPQCLLVGPPAPEQPECDWGLDAAEDAWDTMCEEYIK